MKSKAKTAKYLAWAAELLLFGLAACFFTLGPEVGALVVGVWYWFGFGIVGLLIQESATPQESSATHEPQEAQHRSLVGATGTTVSVLKPGGMILVEGKRIEATSPLGLIQAGAEVRVVGARGNLVVVEEMAQ